MNNTGLIQKGYNAAAEDYAKAYFYELDGKPFDRSLLERFSCAVKEKGMVLDIGCGPGEIACFLHQCGVQATGVDISENMIRGAKADSPCTVHTSGYVCIAV